MWGFGAESREKMEFTNQNKLVALRELMRDSKLNAFIVGSADAHRSEYVCERDLRRSFISEFSGSAGNGIAEDTNRVRRPFRREEIFSTARQHSLLLVARAFN